MFRWFKKHFIPHKGNGHQPYFLRTRTIRAVVACVLLLELGSFVIPSLLISTPLIGSVLPSVLTDLTNQQREVEHLSTLVVNPLLNRVAALKAKDMADKGYFAHTSPEGKAPWYWFTLVGYSYESAGENLAVDFTDSTDVTLAWMNSPTHKANILKNAYTEIGTGIATGTYQGKKTIFVAQVFGKPVLNVSAHEVSKILSTPVTLAESDRHVSSTSISSLKNTSTHAQVAGATTDAMSGTEGTSRSQTLSTNPAQAYAGTTLFEQYATSPRHLVNSIFVALGALVLFALVAKVCIRIDKKHPILVTNGFATLALLFGIYSVNIYVAETKMTTTTSFASFHGEVFDSAQ